MDKIDKLIEEATAENKVNIKKLRQELPPIFHRSFDTWVKVKDRYVGGEKNIKDFYKGELYDNNRKIDLSNYIPLGQNDSYILLYNKKTKKVQYWSHDPDNINSAIDTAYFNQMVTHLDNWFLRVKPKKKASGVLSKEKYESIQGFEKRLNTIFGMPMMIDEGNFENYVDGGEYGGTDLKKYGVAVWPAKIEDFFKYAGTPAFKRKLKN